MPGRSLAYLATVPIEEVKGLSGRRGAALRAAGLETVTDLLLHTPRRYLDRSTIRPIAEAPVGEEVTVVGRVQQIRSRRVRRGLIIVEASVADDSGVLAVTWFNQGYRVGQLPAGTEVVLSGKLERFRGRLQVASPVVEVLSEDEESLTTGRVVPVHPAVAEVSAAHLRRAVRNALRRSQPVDDPVPARVRARRALADRAAAIEAIHFPPDLRSVAPARRRLVYDEFLRIQLALALAKAAKESRALGVAHRGDGSLGERFVAALPYALTGAQRRVIAEISRDMAAPHPMHRLLQGEVGSGKTVVAVAALLVAVEDGHQGAVMAPTEVLAGQHYLAISGLLRDAGLGPVETDVSGTEDLFTDPSPDGPSATVVLLTGSQVACSGMPDARREDVVTMIADGRADIVVGTHALIQEGVRFRGLSAAVVDEQHRFGVGQRVRLKEQAGEVEPDLLIMTATPIPRTLSMTLYGDLDVSILDELPPGRTPIETVAVTSGGLDAVWRDVEVEARAGRQAFVVCPLVEDSPKVEAASATDWYERLGSSLPGLRVALIHGQLRPDEKRAVMDAMRAGTVDLLVATTVIEVGIDIPNATTMVILDADRFGLSQLHQLRGRVGRGRHRGRCVLVADPTTDDGAARIAAMLETNDGFVLAERDLEIRGQGSVFGDRQSGIGDLRLGDILRDTELLVDARTDAFELVVSDPDLAGHPALAEELAAFFPDAGVVDYLFRS